MSFNDIYYENICNNYLDLAYINLTVDEFNTVLYFLHHLKQLSTCIRAKVVDFTDTTVVQSNGCEVYVTKKTIPKELYNTRINFVFNH